MTSRVVSFQIVQGYARNDHSRGYSPDVIALCADGSLWWIGLNDFQHGYNSAWKRMTPDLPLDPVAAVWKPHTNSVS